MRQTVTITRSSDRHAEDHERDFAESHEVSVEAGDLREVLMALVYECPDLPRGRYVIEVGWPFE